MKTEAEIRAHLVQKAEADNTFRSQLLSDPKGTVEKEFGVTVPDGFNMHVHEETKTGAHLVLPPADGKLHAAEMRLVAGGFHTTDGDTW